MFDEQILKINTDKSSKNSRIRSQNKKKLLLKILFLMKIIDQQMEQLFHKCKFYNLWNCFIAKFILIP